MAKTKEAATADAVSDPLYDELSEDGKTFWNQIVDYGWQPYRTPERLWFAGSIADPTAGEIGPSESLSVLFTMVDDYETKGVKTTGKVLDSDRDGNTYLPGANEILVEVDIPELRQPALNYHAYKTERLSALAREVEAKDILDQLMHTHEAELPEDPKTGTKYFKVGSPDGTGRAVVIDLVKGSDKINSRVVEEGV